MEISKAKSAFKKVFAEFSLIVIGVTIALWLENEFEKLKEKETEQAYIQSFVKDWKADVANLKATIEFNKKIKSKSEALFNRITNNGLSAGELPSEIFVLMNYQYFTPQNFTFQSVQETGDFRIISDEKLKRSILRLRSIQFQIAEAQTNFQQALDNYIVPLVNQNVDMARQKLVSKEFLKDHRLTNLILYNINDLQGRIKLCERYLEFVEPLIDKFEDKQE